MSEEVSEYQRIVFVLENKDGPAVSKTSGIHYNIVVCCFEFSNGLYHLIINIVQTNAVIEENTEYHKRHFKDMDSLKLYLSKMLSNFNIPAISILTFDKSYGIPEEEKIIDSWKSV